MFYDRLTSRRKELNFYGFMFHVCLIIIDMSTEASDMTVNETIFNATFV